MTRLVFLQQLNRIIDALDELSRLAEECDMFDTSYDESFMDAISTLTYIYNEILLEG